MCGGGPDGNRQLTARIGVVLLVLLAALGVTIPDLRLLIAEHLFIGLLLLGPVAAKLGSTGYRFVRYYTGNPAYRGQGPPEPALRMIAPIMVLSTMVVFASGLVLLFEGPTHRNPWLEIHKLSFILWLVFMAVHVLGHLVDLPHALGAAREARRSLPVPATGAGGRWITLVGSAVAGLVLAIALLPNFGPWTASKVFAHHHDHETAAVSPPAGGAPSAPLGGRPVLTGRTGRPATRG